jgi:hypothetical protein
LLLSPAISDVYWTIPAAKFEILIFKHKKEMLTYLMNKLKKEGEILYEKGEKVMKNNGISSGV